MIRTSNLLDNTCFDYKYESAENLFLPQYGMKADTNPFRYCGEYFDEETGFVYLRARYYSPDIGRFVSEDPIKDGNNWYVYCGNNPLCFLDSTGMVVTTWDLQNCTKDEIAELKNNDIIWNTGNEIQQKIAAESSKNIRLKHAKDNEQVLSNGYVEETFPRQYSANAYSEDVTVETLIVFSKTYTDKYTYINLKSVSVDIDMLPRYSIDSMQINVGQASPLYSTKTEFTDSIVTSYEFAPNWENAFDDGGEGFTVVGVFVDVSFRRGNAMKTHNLQITNQVYTQETVYNGRLIQSIDLSDVLQEALARGER